MRFPSMLLPFDNVKSVIKLRVLSAVTIIYHNILTCKLIVPNVLSLFSFDVCRGRINCT